MAAPGKGKGRFKPQNPEKYKGDPTDIIYRSNWELTCMMKFDMNPNVLEWSSERVKVPYRSKIDDLIEQRRGYNGPKRIHTYYVDFFVKVKTKSGNIKRLLIEVKPKKDTKEPKKEDFKGRNADRRYRNAIVTWEINKAKWKAAKEYAEDRGMSFEVFTEEHIYGNG